MAESLPAAQVDLLPLSQAAEDMRRENVQEAHGETSQTVVDFTEAPLFLDLLQRPDLALRDRNLVTVSALVANGQSAQVPYHLGRAMGLTRDGASGALTQLAFYSGWPNALSAMPVFRGVFDGRIGLI